MPRSHAVDVHILQPVVVGHAWLDRFIQELVCRPHPAAGWRLDRLKPGATYASSTSPSPDHMTSSKSDSPEDPYLFSPFPYTAHHCYQNHKASYKQYYAGNAIRELLELS